MVKMGNFRLRDRINSEVVKLKLYETFSRGMLDGSISLFRCFQYLNNSSVEDVHGMLILA